ncbi:arginine--tRNA ligase [Candidatus Nomurabacteria bacterium]|nr:arginine--tRNA ligase [Candidatus Nomurabacteria bacterium]
MEQSLIEGINKALREYNLSGIDFSLEHPKELSNGDYATNVALIAGKKIGKNPLEIAGQILAELEKQNIEGIEKIEIAGPGFINFTLKREIFIAGLSCGQDKEWGNTEVYKGQKILVEHSSPNLFKPFHIGHLMNNTIGESLYRLAKSSGAQATPISFPSDISLGVAKAIYILLEKYGENFTPSDVSILGEAYVEGVRKYEEAEKEQPCGSIVYRVKEIADNLYAQKDSPELRLFNICKEFNIEYFENIVKDLGSEFDSYIYESEAGVDGKRIVIENTPKVFSESEGAIVYVPEENKKLHTSVFINSQGNPTYEAKDLGLLDLKFKSYNPDQSIFVTDGQQVSHFQVVLDAGGKINPAWQEKSFHRYHGRMSFKGQKMSSRLGNTPIVEDILNTIIEEVKEKNPDIENSSAKIIAISAIKFAILRTQAGKDINFDPETSLSFEGDSGPYLQYTAVRAGSLIEKAKSLGINPSIENPIEGTETLERLIARFLEVISRSQREWAPHYIVTYLLDIAQEFNSWYGQAKIVDEDKEATAYRLYVVSAVRQTLINGLWVLGIETPEKM